jgi:hypothetical protein
MASQTVARPPASSTLAALLDSPEVADLISELDALRWTGRRGYGTRALVGACLVKSLYAIPTWSRTAALIAEHAALQDALGAAPRCTPATASPRSSASRNRCWKPVSPVIASLAKRLPEYGVDVAVDASDLPAFANGQRYVSKGGRKRERFSDPDASWGHRSAISTRKGGGFYGYKLSAAVCARTELPVAWTVATARTHEASLADELLGQVKQRVAAQTATLDKGYDTQPVHDACERNELGGSGRG